MKKNLLRSLVFTFSFLLLTFNLHSQWVSIPDTNFGTWLNTHGYSICLQGNNTVGWQMDTACSTITSALSLACNNAHITDLTGIEYFDHLENLGCISNQLTSLPSLPNSLTSLGCSSNQLTNLPALPNSLTGLYCQENSLTNLPALPNSLVNFHCGYNQLTNLPVLPNSLAYLNCSSNQLTNLPALPNSLTLLVCVGNNLANLPTLPNLLTSLNCRYNQLTDLPVLPNSLSNLDCIYNQLTNLPTLPNSLVYLFCSSNQLVSLPQLPDSLSYLYCDNNPTLFCLPMLKKIGDFNFTNTGITCLPNYPQSNTSSTPALASVPLCDIFNANGCEVYWNISGTVYADSNANCVMDAGENRFSNVKVMLYQNSILQEQKNVIAGGLFSFDTDLGNYTYTVDTTNLPVALACPASGYYSSAITALDSFDADMNFGLRCKPGFDVGVQSINGWDFRPASLRQVIIQAGDLSNFYNANCATGTSGTVSVSITGAAHYASPASGALTPSNVSGNVLTYAIADFGTIDFNSSFNIMVQTDTTAVLGSQICFTVSVTPTAGDNNSANNILTQCFTVVSSYDPNEKEVYPATAIDTAQKWLTYTIHFQNTGTAPAQHIYVTDTLSQYVEEASFQLLAYSVQPVLQIKGKAVRFNFPNINLPDSNHNEAASHGYVQYKVMLKENLPIGTTINNTAFIYFDFNAPVVTNTTTNTITNVTAISPLSTGEGLGVRLYPNPANSFVTIAVDERMVGSSLLVTDITGRKMKEEKLKTEITKLEILSFAKGVYFISVVTAQGTTVVRKLVVE